MVSWTDCQDVIYQDIIMIIGAMMPGRLTVVQNSSSSCCHTIRVARINFISLVALRTNIRIIIESRSWS